MASRAPRALGAFATFALGATALLGACVQHGGLSVAEPRGNLRAATTPTKSDPTVLGARLIPEVVEDERSFGVEAGGGVRAIVSGVRVVSQANGALLAADDRLPKAPAFTVAVPERMGGGFLFVIDNAVWRAPKWLERAKPIYASPWSAISRVVVGLDRVYLKGSNGAHRAIDPRTGTPVDAGAFPGAPYVGSFGALDGWRAVAVTDLRGAMATFDAGASWKPLGLPIDAKDVIPVEDGIAVGGADASRTSSWYLVHPDGQVSKLANKPERRDVPQSWQTVSSQTALTDFSGATTQAGAKASMNGAIAKSLGKRPLVAAIEDGWPMADQTAVVARDGALARVRLQDGALIDFAPDAFALKPSRCHPIALSGRGDFGFVCGEPRGKTVIYAYDAAHGRLVELRHFDRPRVVLGSGTGAIAVRGGCAEDAPSDNENTMPPVRNSSAPGNEVQVGYCIRPEGGPWREVQIHGRLSGDRVVALADGRVVVISPPHGNMTAARLTVLDASKKVSTVPIVFSTTSPEALRVLRAGLWLDGFEERGRNMVGGWVEAGGTFLGVQIQLDGQARAGAFVRDAGSPIVSGRYGLGWSAARRGYETTDGGMTWEPIDLPEPIAQGSSALTRNPTSRACGPAGCLAAGWVRVGWGPPKVAPMEPSPTSRAVRRPVPILELTCEATRHTAPTAPTAPPPRGPIVMPEVVLPHSVTWNPGTATGARPLPLSNLDWSPFFAMPAPKLPAEELGLSIETSEALDRTPRTGPLLRLYAWGAKGSEWERTSRWMVRFTSPYAGSQEIQTTQTTPTPRVVIDSSRFATGGGIPRPVSSWQFASADDGTHALLVARRLSPVEAVPIELEADKPPLEIRRNDGEAFGVIDAAERIGGRWILAGPQSGSELPATVVWEVEGGTARELVRVPRAADNSVPPVRLARRPDGRSIGLVVDGQPDPDRSVPLRWLLPIDLSSGAMGELEPLGSTDFADRDAITACSGDEPGWIVDVPMTSTVHVQMTSGLGSQLRSATARVRISSDRLCIERMSGSLDGTPDALTRGGKLAPVRPATKDAGATIDIAAYNARTRFPLRCTKK
ncbi:hypothetical protein LVJ94_00055 [Pendulispora rubella]|uniref:Uncharacterized protein n=1 Tax=Pendulispora rubella TaxID=2741070 RepID=A0ABZ2L770_9BACT